MRLSKKKPLPESLYYMEESAFLCDFLGYYLLRFTSIKFFKRAADTLLFMFCTTANLLSKPRLFLNNAQKNSILPLNCG